MLEGVLRMADLTAGGNLSAGMEDLYTRRIPDYAARRDAALYERSAINWPEKITAPLLLLHGDADPYVLADPVDRTQRYAPRGRYVALAGIGHFAHEEAPQEVNEHLRRFLAQVYGPAT